MRDLIVVAHNIRSTHNVGSLFRTAEGLGVSRMYLCGITPCPTRSNDDRLPHVAAKLDRQIEKTALGASRHLAWEYAEDTRDVLENLKTEGYEIIALEQSAGSVSLHQYDAPSKVALVLGNEVSGLDGYILELAGKIVEIPMFGKKESFNVVQAAAMALYRLRFY